MEEAHIVCIGRSPTSRLALHPLRRERPDATDYWDGNWVETSVVVAAGAFRGEFQASLRVEDFARFRDEVRVLYESLAGRARFRTMEDWISVEIEGDGKGLLRVECSLVDEPGVGNRLTFTLGLDQTDLPEILRRLDAICGAFPTIGAPP